MSKTDVTKKPYLQGYKTATQSYDAKVKALRRVRGVWANRKNITDTLRSIRRDRDRALPKL